MNTMLFRRWGYFVAIAGVAFLFAITLPHRIEHFDDAWCTEQSYWLFKEGRARSEMFWGIDYWHERLYVFHKGFIYAQVPVLWLFNFSLVGAKMTSLLFGLVGLALLLRYFRGQWEAQALATFLYLGCGTLVMFGFDNRPDTMVAAFGLASYLVLSRGALPPGRLVLAGGLAGLAAFSHLNGLVFIATGALWLWLERGWRPALGFGAVAGTMASFYLLDALLDGRLDRLIYQFQHYHSAAANHSLTGKLQVMTHYHQTFFHSEGESFLSGLLLLTLGVLALRRATWPRLRPSLRYLLLLLGTFWLLTKSNTAYYYLLFVPFLVLVVVDYLLVAAPRLAPWQRWVVLAVLLIYPVGTVLRASFLLQENHSYPDTATENARLARYMPKRGSVAIVPLDFFFNEIGNYRLRALTVYSMRNAEQYHDTLSVPGFFALAAQDSAEYVVTDHRLKNDVYYVPANAPARIGQYERVFRNAWHSVYRRAQP